MAEPAYWICTWCDDQVDETDICCDEGRIEPVYKD